MTVQDAAAAMPEAPVRNRRERRVAEADSARVVVFRSPVTDVRALTARLAAAGVEYREVELSMASYVDRERFHALQAYTGWRTLPQVFVAGEFVGGEPELAGHGVLSGGSRTPELERPVRWLGYGGVLPFAFGLLAVGLLDDPALRLWAGQLTLAYGAVILAFLGAVHWGRLLERRTLQQAPLLALWGVLPSVAGWLSLALPLAWAAPLQVLLFQLVYLMDRRLLRGEPAAQPYLRLRGRLTGLVASLMLGTWAVGTLL